MYGLPNAYLRNNTLYMNKMQVLIITEFRYIRIGYMVVMCVLRLLHSRAVNGILRKVFAYLTHSIYSYYYQQKWISNGEVSEIHREEK